jgi:prevent-host-death family protein
MMTAVKRMSSHEARQCWREVLDTVKMGSSDIAITRHGQPVVVLIPAADYEEILEELDELRLTRLADGIYEEYLQNKRAAVSFEEVKKELRIEE